MRCSKDINNESFVHHIDTLVITQRMYMYSVHLYTEQEILHTHLLCSCLNINQSAGNISKDNSNTHTKKENSLIKSLFKTREVSREMQRDRVTSEHINITLKKSKSKWSSL